jgi:hypothetical protein
MIRTRRGTGEIGRRVGQSGVLKNARWEELRVMMEFLADVGHGFPQPRVCRWVWYALCTRSRLPLKRLREKFRLRTCIKVPESP